MSANLDRVSELEARVEDLQRNNAELQDMRVKMRANLACVSELESRVENL